MGNEIKLANLIEQVMEGFADVAITREMIVV
jgi:hypothetical protein